MKDLNFYREIYGFEIFENLPEIEDLYKVKLLDVFTDGKTKLMAIQY